MDTKGGKGAGGGGVMNWEIGIDIYTLIRIKQITNKNLLYKKINKIKILKTVSTPSNTLKKKKLYSEKQEQTVNWFDVSGGLHLNLAVCFQ